MKAAAPMTGGMICPPLEAQASTAPAKWGRYPTLFMRGMVKEPVVTTLATALPETVAIRALETMDAFAGPPTLWPVRERARLMKNLPAPERIRMEPKRMKRKI